MISDAKRLFEKIREIKGSALTQADVDAINAVLQPHASNGKPKAVARALPIIKQFEGCELKAYKCPADVPTIGWGATGPDIKIGMTWTQAQADERLEADVSRFAKGVDALLGSATTTDGQRAAMISLAYNIGLGALGKSTLLALHKAGDFGGAHRQFARWNKAGGRELAGLTRRREAEAKEYAS